MNKILKVFLVLFVLGIFTVGGFGGGFVAGAYFSSAGLPVGAPGLSLPVQLPPAVSTPQGSADATPQDLQTLFVPFWETWNLLHEEYVDQPLDDTKLMQGAIRGMLESLGDQHTSYMDPDQFNQANMSISGEYDGIGAWVDASGDYLTIISPMPGSPAEQAGLQPGDKVIAIDGEDMTGIPGDLVIRRVLGPAGSTVQLTIVREGESKPLDFEIIRAHIVVPSVESKMLDNGIGYIKLNTFGDNSTSELRAALKEILAQKPRGLVLDLRNNGGGYLTTAIEVVSEFIGEGVVMVEKFGDGESKTYNAQRGGMATEIPLVVLVNKGTASASEIVAGAVQDYARGKVVGETTFGKGSVQIWTPLSNNQGAVRVTVAKWFTPKERSIHEVGLTPDVVVELTEEDAKADRDPQLEKALEVLEELIAATK